MNIIMPNIHYALLYIVFFMGLIVIRIPNIGLHSDPDV